MADTKTSDLTDLTNLADGDKLMVVDVSDTTMDASGTNKDITAQNALCASTQAWFAAQFWS